MMQPIIRDRELEPLPNNVPQMALRLVRKRGQLPQPLKLNNINVTPETQVREALRKLTGVDIGDAA